MDTFEALLGRIPTDTGADQMIALRTAGGRIYVMENRSILSGDHGDEDLFLGSLALQDDTPVTHLVCMWYDGALDLPSMHFRRGLLEINGNNGRAGILLQGEYRYLVKQLADTLPK